MRLARIEFTVLATNSYFPLGIRLYKHLHKFASGDFTLRMVVNCERPEQYLSERFMDRIAFERDNHDDWLSCMYLKTKWMLAAEGEYNYYLDADTDLVKHLNLADILGPMVGAEHFMNRSSPEKAYDRNKESMAYIPEDTQLPQMYYHAAFFGGMKEVVRAMCLKLQEWKEADAKIHYEPRWNDESYINRYFHYHPPKVIALEDFPFVISDKGGIEEGCRNVSNPWDHEGLLENRDRCIEIVKGEVIPEPTRNF